MLARIAGMEKVDEQFEALMQTNAANCSTAGSPIEGAVNIEGWIGACEAALGAGAVAALIGASMGCAAPRAGIAENSAAGPKTADSPATIGADRGLSWIMASSTGQSALALALDI